MSRESFDWMPKTFNKKKLKCTISDIGVNDPQSEAPHVLRLFIGEKGQYGLGECFFWEHKTVVEDLKHSLPVLRKLKFKDDSISLSDVIEWKDLKIKGFGVKPPAISFKYKISWRKFCILLIEIGFRILGVDPDVHVQGPTAKDNRSNPNDYDSADDFEPPNKLSRPSSLSF